jgi:hypothetical protein
LSDLPAAPYPADTRAKGWRFELDLERVMQSDTWALASPDIRPWLLMLWTVAWQQVPCGSMPSDDDLIAARLGMKAVAFKKAKPVLMRGWWLADDGRLYHGTIAERVLDMLGRKESDRKRKAEYRARMEAERKAAEGSSVPGMSHGTDGGQSSESTVRDDTSTGTSTGIKNKNLSVPDGTDADASQGLTAHEAIFQIGVPWLVEHAGADVKESNIRSMLGGAEKHLQPEGAWQLVQDCMRAKPLQPVAWLAAAINDRKKVAPGVPAQRAKRGNDRNDRTAAAAAIFGTGTTQGEVIDV